MPGNSCHTLLPHLNPFCCVLQPAFTMQASLASACLLTPPCTATRMSSPVQCRAEGLGGGGGVQEVVVEEAVAAVDAAGREALSEFCSWILGAPATAAALAGLRAMGPLRPLLLPLPTPLELLSRWVHALPAACRALRIPCPAWNPVPAGAAVLGGQEH